MDYSAATTVHQQPAGSMHACMYVYSSSISANDSAADEWMIVKEQDATVLDPIMSSMDCLL